MGHRCVYLFECIEPTLDQKLHVDHQDTHNGNWSSFQLANSTSPQSVIDHAIAPSARMPGGRVNEATPTAHT